MPTGKIWCEDCKFTVNNKEVYNPFMVDTATGNVVKCKFPSYEEVIHSLNNDPAFKADNIFPPTWNYRDFYNRIKKFSNMED